MATRRKSVENVETAPKAASTVFTPGMWLQWNGTGEVEPLTTVDPVAGLCLEPIATTDVDYATTRQIHFDQGIQPTDRFLMTVGTGSATEANIGNTYDVATSSTLDVSGPGTQFRVTQVLSATLVEVAVAKYHADLT